MSAAPEIAIETVRAGHRYGHQLWGLRECTLTLPTGSITAVVGANGAGKTTLLNMLVGLLPASEGQLRVVGDQPSSKPTFLARIGFPDWPVLTCPSTAAPEGCPAGSGRK